MTRAHCIPERLKLYHHQTMDHRGSARRTLLAHSPSPREQSDRAKVQLDDRASSQRPKEGQDVYGAEEESRWWHPDGVAVHIDDCPWSYGPDCCLVFFVLILALCHQLRRLFKLGLDAVVTVRSWFDNVSRLTTHSKFRHVHRIIRRFSYQWLYQTLLFDMCFPILGGSDSEAIPNRGLD